MRVAVQPFTRALRLRCRMLDQYWPARANEPVCGAANVAAAAAAPRVRGIGFAPETIALAKCDLPRFKFVQEMPSMTAYLISLAIAGLIALAICDALL